jgi:hypothetical protein
MRGKLPIVLIFLLVACSAFAIAQTGTFSIDRETISNYIVLASDVANYKITVTNDLGADEHFRISFPDEGLWTIMTGPEISYKMTGFDLAAGETKEISVSVRPKAEAIEGGYLNINTRYEIKYEVIAEAAAIKRTDFITVYYGPKFERPSYPAVIIADIEMPAKVDPRQGLEIRVHLKNRNPLNITALDIFLKSDLVNQHVTVDLGPIEEKTVIINQPLDPLESPKKDNLTVSVEYQGKTVQTSQETFEILAYSQFEEKESLKRDNFYKTTTSLEYRNNGNVKKEENVTHEFSFMKALFATTNPKGTLINQGGKTMISWNLELSPNETTTIKIVENYLPIIIIILVALATFIVLKMLRGPVTAVKQVGLISKKEGGIGGLKVVLKVKNTSGSTIHELEVVDSVPNIVEID